MPEIFQYGFMVRAFIAGIVIAVTSPLIGMFLVAKRYSLIADTMGHIALAGVALGFLLNVPPVAVALVVTVMASIVIDRLKNKERVSGESALAMFLSGGLALAVVLISFAHAFTVDLFSYLFGSITTVKSGDLVIVVVIGMVVAITSLVFYKELLYLSFDEESAKVAGVPTGVMNILLMTLSAVTVSLSIRVVGTLLIGALMVIPVVAAAQVSRSFRQNLVLSVLFSLVAVVIGLIASYYLNLAAGGTIVLVALLIFGITLLLKRW